MLSLDSCRRGIQLEPFSPWGFFGMFRVGLCSASKQMCRSCVDVFTWRETRPLFYVTLCSVKCIMPSHASDASPRVTRCDWRSSAAVVTTTSTRPRCRRLHVVGEASRCLRCAKRDTLFLATAIFSCSLYS